MLVGRVLARQVAGKEESSRMLVGLGAVEAAEVVEEGSRLGLWVLEVGVEALEAQTL